MPVPPKPRPSAGASLFLRQSIYKLLAGTSLLLFLTGCEAGYYWQSVSGHLGLQMRRQPTSRLLSDPATPADLRNSLTLAQEIRDFATAELFLPDNDNYRDYVALKHPFVVWNLVAAPADSVTPVEWCFPVAGCVSYRGYYDPQDAADFEVELQGKGLETYRYGVRAYSTLGWFNDPLLSSMTELPDYRLAALIFHELAHQVVYVKGDSSFNESFAEVVEEAGIERWLAIRNDPEQLQLYRDEEAAGEAFTDLVIPFRNRLDEAFISARSAQERVSRKKALYRELQKAFAAARETTPALRRYDRWMEGINNARIASVATYRTWVPALRNLLAGQESDLPRFYEVVKALAELPREEREEQLKQLGEGLPLPRALQPPSPSV